jgi:hypothetical protein
MRLTSESRQRRSHLHRRRVARVSIVVGLAIISVPASGQLRRDDTSRVALDKLCDRSLPAGGARCPQERVVALDVRFLDPDSAQARVIVDFAAWTNGLFTIGMQLAGSRDSAQAALITIQGTPSGGFEIATRLRDSITSRPCGSARAATVTGDRRMLFGAVLMHATETFFRCVRERRGIL